MQTVGCSTLEASCCLPAELVEYCRHLLCSVQLIHAELNK